MTPFWRRPGQRARQELHQRCTKKVRDLGFPVDQTLTISDVCEIISERTARPIAIYSLELPEGMPDGILYRGEESDVILFEERLTPIHRRHVILHELGHLVCGHLPAGRPGETTQHLLPSLATELVGRMLCRAHDGTESETEAEYVGSLLGQKVTSLEAGRPCPVPPGQQALVARLSALEPISPQRP
jgi:hypothetical protein